MSDLIFPTLRGLTYPITKTPNHSTITQRGLGSGIPKFLQLYSYPYYTLKMVFEYLSDNNDQRDDIHTLMGFYNRMGGAGQDFLFADPKFESNEVNNQLFGVGDGTSTSFRLARNYGGLVEPVFGLVMTPIILINGIPTTAFTWNTAAMITFATAPTLGARLTWCGDWYYRCHFKEDTNDFEQIFCDAWELQELELETIKL
ncbi:hypothetical protein Ga0466249_002298 [Sporomusaceae bacterium BoRhaA]|uniref:DUF2460 domain-containing protein n=1 Tax=Pelorhabdus rhamnosifermentans TaxID=2772457 RepID=UPI001C0613DC|nr:DUF2460 domain-containing protein [Pelorhabdus rhamnosifermentans]MBU2701184.1 hypothetical protein [Pelorhabdus rhamnosifermentans]